MGQRLNRTSKLPSCAPPRETSCTSELEGTLEIITSLHLLSEEEIFPTLSLPWLCLVFLIMIHFNSLIVHLGIIGK